MMKTVMWDFNSSYRRSLEEYYDKIDTDFNSIKHEVNKSYSTLHIDFNEWSENYNKCEKDIRKMTSIMSELITSYSQSAKNYSNKVEEMNERCKTLQIYLNNCTENFDKCENELRGYIEKDFKKFTNETLLKLDKIREVKDKKNECNKGKLHQRFQNSELNVLDTTSIVNIISKFFMLFLYNETLYGIKSFKKIYDNNQRKGLTKFTCCS